MENFRSVFTQCRPGVYFAIFLSSTVGLLSLTVPIYMLQLFDRVLVTGSTDTLFFLTVIAIVSLATMSAINYVRTRVLNKLASFMEIGICELVLGHSGLQLAGREGFTRLLLKDAKVCSAALSGSAFMALLDLPWSVVSLVVIFLLHPILGSVALAGGTALIGLVLLYQVFLYRILSKKGLGAKMYSCSEAFLAMGLVPRMFHRWQRGSLPAVETQWRTAQFLSVAKFIRMALHVSILAVGAMLILGGRVTPGAMIAASILAARALGPFEAGISGWKQVLVAYQSFKRLKSAFKEKGVVKHDMALPAPNGPLIAKNVSYIFPRTDRFALKDVSFSVEPGEVMAIVGPMESGKTTLIRLILGLLQPSFGEMRLDGTDVVRWDRPQLGPYIGCLPQHKEFVETTVSEWIGRFGEYDHQKVVEAAETVRAHKLILQLPKGYDTKIKPGGSNLSGTLKQLLGLAQVLYDKPRLCVMDDPIAHLDTDGVSGLENALRKAKAWGAIVIVASHRPQLFKSVDKVLILEDGRVSMFGPMERVLMSLQSNVVDKVKAVKASLGPGRSS